MKKLAAIGTCTLGVVPRVVAVVDRPLSLMRARRLKACGADILEVRGDLFPCSFEKTLCFVRSLRRESGIPLIGTIRESTATRGKRIEMFERLTPLVDAIDVEVDAEDKDSIIKLARGKTLIVSEHDFSATPSMSRLSSIVSRATQMGADIIKIAALARNRDEVVRLLGFAAKRRENLVVISMGAYGAVSRIVAPLFGSLFTYAFISKSVAPGQLSLKDTAALFSTFFPPSIHVPHAAAAPLANRYYHVRQVSMKAV